MRAAEDDRSVRCEGRRVSGMIYGSAQIALLPSGPSSCADVTRVAARGRQLADR